MNNSFHFDVEEKVKALGVKGAYFVISGIRNAEAQAEFDELNREAIRNIHVGLLDHAIDDDPTLSGFRTLHERVGASNRKYVASPENMLCSLKRTGMPVRVNLLVDIYNLVSLETRLALGAHDVDHISGGVHLRITNGSERFVPLGADQPKPTRQGMYAYIDDTDEVLCYLEVRQVEKTKVTLSTTDCFYIVQGNPATSLAYIKAAAERTMELTRRYCGGEVTFVRYVE